MRVTLRPAITRASGPLNGKGRLADYCLTFACLEDALANDVRSIRGVGQNRAQVIDAGQKLSDVANGKVFIDMDGR